MKDFFFEYDSGNWQLLIAHIIGVDHAGHFYSNAKHPEIERKILDMEKILLGLLYKLDKDTILLAFGDHGMTN